MNKKRNFPPAACDIVIRTDDLEATGVIEQAIAQSRANPKKTVGLSTGQWITPVHRDMDRDDVIALHDAISDGFYYLSRSTLHGLAELERAFSARPCAVLAERLSLFLEPEIRQALGQVGERKLKEAEAFHKSFGDETDLSSIEKMKFLSGRNKARELNEIVIA